MLIAINHGDMIVEGGPIDWLKICLTYCVPYGVATFAGVRAKQADARSR